MDRFTCIGNCLLDGYGAIRVSSRWLSTEIHLHQFDPDEFRHFSNLDEIKNDETIKTLFFIKATTKEMNKSIYICVSIRIMFSLSLPSHATNWQLLARSARKWTKNNLYVSLSLSFSLSFSQWDAVAAAPELSFVVVVVASVDQPKTTT